MYQERIKFAEERKDQGNGLLKQEHYSESITRYVQALAYLGEVYASEDADIKAKKVCRSATMSVPYVGLCWCRLDCSLEETCSGRGQKYYHCVHTPASHTYTPGPGMKPPLPLPYSFFTLGNVK